MNFSLQAQALAQEWACSIASIVLGQLTSLENEDLASRCHKHNIPVEMNRPRCGEKVIRLKRDNFPVSNLNE